MKPTVIDLFAGCGGLSYGFTMAGFEVVGFVEFWKPAIETYLKNHPHAVHIGTDICKVSDDVLQSYKGKIDIIAGGPPCQGFSLCGSRDVNDKRNQLYKEFLRFVRVINPKVVVLENVVGLLSMYDIDGEPIISKILRDFIKLDYSVSYKVLTASEYGVPQDRRRLFFIAQKRDIFPEKVEGQKTVIESIGDIPNEYGALNGHFFFETQDATVAKIKKLKEGEKMSKKYNFSRQRLKANEPSKTVTTQSMFIHPIYDRFLTARELARLQSFPDDFAFTGSKTAMVKQIGNAVPPLLAYSIAKQIMEVEHA